MISAGRVANSPVSFECQLTNSSQLNTSADDFMDRWFVLDEVVGILIYKTFLENGVYQPAKARPIMR